MPSSGCKKSARSEEHTSELQSHDNLVCRLLLEKKEQRNDRDGAREWSGGCGVVRVCAVPAPPESAASPPIPRAPSTATFPFLSFFFLKVGAPPELNPFPPRAPLRL